MGCPALHIDSRFSAYTPKLEVVRDFEYLLKLDVAPKRTTPKKVFKYYPYGMLMPGRFGEVANSSYRYGFNGMEKDDEVMGQGNFYTTEFRQYDPRNGSWMTVDPLAREYPGMSPYNFAGNNSIIFVDLGGDTFEIYYNETNSETGKTVVKTITFNGTKALNEDGTKYIMGTNQFVDDVIASYNYIVDNDADINGAMKHVATATEVTKIKYTSSKEATEYYP